MKKKYKRVFSINNDLGYRNYTVRDLINLKGKRKLTQIRVTTVHGRKNSPLDGFLHFHK